MLHVLALVACSPSPESGGADPVGIPNRVHVARGFLRDDRGYALFLHGANNSNTSKEPSTGFLGWTEQPDVERLAGWGFNSVRLLTFWEAVEPEEGVIDEDYLAAFDERVAWATDAGLYVIVDMHQDLYGRGFSGNGAPEWTCDQAFYDSYQPREPWSLNYFSGEVTACFDQLWASTELWDHYTLAWQAVAERYADDPMVIGFDLMNEPWKASNDMTAFDAEVMQPFYERVIEGVAEVAPDKIFFIEPGTLVQYGTYAPGFTPIEGVQLVYAPHFYLPTVHEGEAYDGDWGPIEKAFASYEQTARALDSTWWLGEYGGLASAEGFEQYLLDVEGLLAKHGVGSAYWSYDPGHGFAFIDEEGELNPEFDGTLVRPYVHAVGGDPTAMSFDGSSLTVSFDPVDGLSPIVEIWSPVEGLVQISAPSGELSWP